MRIKELQEAGRFEKTNITAEEGSPEDDARNGNPTESEHMQGADNINVEISNIPLLLNVKNRRRENTACHSWSSARDFLCRGPTYLQDGVKYPSPESLMEPIAVGLWEGRNVDTLIHTASRQFGCEKGKLGGSSIIIDLELSADRHVILQFQNHDMPDEDEEESGSFPISPAQVLLEKFIFKSENAWRAKRLKLLPRLHNAGFVVRKAVGSRPVILASKLATQFLDDRENRTLIIKVDISSSVIAGTILNLVEPQVKKLDIDLAFIVEGATDDELPEVPFGSICFHKLDLSKFKRFDG